MFQVKYPWFDTTAIECHSGRGRGVDNPAIKMEQKHFSEDIDKLNVTIKNTSRCF